MKKHMKGRLLPLLSVCIILAVLLQLSVGVTFGSGSVSFSGVSSWYIVPHYNAAYGSVDTMAGVSAERDGVPLVVRVRSVTRLYSVKEKVLDESGAWTGAYRTVNAFESIALNGSSFHVADAGKVGSIYWITYDAFASAEDTQALATVHRPVIAVDYEVTPFMNASTSSDYTGATCSPGDTITYTIGLYNDKSGWSYDVTAPIPAGTEYVSGGTLTGDVVKWSGFIATNETTYLRYTVRVKDAAAGTSIQNKIECMYGGWYQAYSNSSADAKNIGMVVTEVNGELPATTYGVVYHANGGENPPADSSEYAAGDIITLATPGSMSREGYTFLGWSTGASATVPAYPLADILAGTAVATMPSDEEMQGQTALTFYAVWRKNITQVNVSWGAMSFTYQAGTWNPETHTYDGGSWLPILTNGNRIQVINTGNTSVTVRYRYDAQSAYSNITGSFFNASGESVASSSIASGAAPASVWLRLTGSPSGALSAVTLGTVTVILEGT